MFKWFRSLNQLVLTKNKYYLIEFIYFVDNNLIHKLIWCREINKKTDGIDAFNTTIDLYHKYN